MSYNLTYKSFGERSILIEWPQIIDKDILYDVLAFKETIQNSNIKALPEVNNAYNSLLVVYSLLEFNFENKVKTLKEVYKNLKKIHKPTFNLWKIPVCYDSCFGIDIEALANSKNISVENLVILHTETYYTVYFIGFLPGFLYLAGLNEVLHTPRKATPRLKIEKGAVAIGGAQTGVYPCKSPGGWNIIGNSPINFFNIENEVPCFATSGDQIQFYAISKHEHANIKTLVEAGVYQIESEVMHG
ncbi:5-oxoprolinase subunit PxpB [Seonamhaeicola aphaedonensis]|uniref:Inhibitor of KinA n=1 Tax=Seonamhaeicola aphaedonensis TaxID=1461338 RepID=A0A3D9HIG3_9FLAO|nr:5-oxoprolinase subunit PxpB [Seonamhaeicola aphaedonensis]RED49248.1 inhibitor of KinA [Seonamhaeicola aphaedonensis]